MPTSNAIVVRTAPAVETHVSGEALTANDLVYMSPGNAEGDTGRTQGRVYKCDAGNASPALAAIRSRAIGFVQSSVLSGVDVIVQVLSVKSGFSTLVPGRLYYADPSVPGGVTVTEPTTIGQWLVPVGAAISADEILVNPSIASDASLIAAGGGLSAPVVKTSAYDLVDGDRIIADTSGGPFTLTLPPAATVGWMVEIWDSQSTWATNNLTIARNGSNIDGSPSDLVCNVSGAKVQLVYMAGLRGWGVF